MTQKHTQELNKMVRDFSQIAAPSKSEIRRRINDYIASHFISKEELQERIDGCRETTIDGMWWVNRNDLLEEIQKLCK